MITASEAIIGSLLVAIVVLLATDPSRAVADPQPFQIASVPVASPRSFARVMPASISQPPQDSYRDGLEDRVSANADKIRSVLVRVEKLELKCEKQVETVASKPKPVESKPSKPNPKAVAVEPEIVYSAPVRQGWSVSSGGGSTGQVSRVYQSFPQPVVSGSSTGNYAPPVQSSSVYSAPVRTWSNQILKQTPIKSAIRFGRPNG